MMLHRIAFNLRQHSLEIGSLPIRPFQTVGWHPKGSSVVKHISHFVLTGLLLVISMPQMARAQQAQKKVMPRITIVHPGVKSLRNDLKAMFSLTSKSERKQWKNVNDFLEQFLKGVNEDRPIRIDFLAEKSNLPMLLSVPVNDVGDFRDGIEILGVVTDPERKDKSLYESAKAYEGFMRYLKGYASFATKKNDIAAILLGDRSVAIKDLVSRKYNLGIEIVNTEMGQAERNLRRRKFADSRANLMAAIKKQPTESKAAFALRRLAAEHQMDEAERFLADIDRLTAGFNLKPRAAGATLSMDLKPIEGSELAKTIADFGKTVSIFANVKREPNAILSLRVNHPLDEMRKENLAEFWEKALPNSVERIDKSERSAGEKAAAKELWKHMLGMLKLGSDAGIIDAFVEVTKEANGKHTMVSGLKVPPGCDLIKMLDLVPQASTKQKLEKNVAKYGDTAIHKLTLSTKYRAEFNDFFANNGVIWVGTSANGLWTAVGSAGAENKLKAAIEEVGKESTGEVGAPTIDLMAHLRPWIDLKNKVEARLPVPKEKKKKSRRQEMRDLGRRALDSMTDKDDVITFKLKRVEDRVEGVTDYGTGVIRLLGKLLAKFSRENLGTP